MLAIDLYEKKARHGCRA